MTTSADYDVTMTLAHNGGYTCLLVVFLDDVMLPKKTNKYPDSSMPMFAEIESTVRYLLKIGQKHRS